MDRDVSARYSCPNAKKLSARVRSRMQSSPNKVYAVFKLDELDGVEGYRIRRQFGGVP